MVHGSTEDNDMTRWIIIAGIALVAIALIAYGGNYVSNLAKKTEIVEEQEKITEVLATGLSQTDEKLIDAWKEIQENKKEIERLKQGRIDIEKEKVAIVVPDNITDLVAGFNRHGFRARARSVLPAK